MKALLKLMQWFGSKKVTPPPKKKPNKKKNKINKPQNPKTKQEISEKTLMILKFRLDKIYTQESNNVIHYFDSVLEILHSTLKSRRAILPSTQSKTT